MSDNEMFFNVAPQDLVLSTTIPGNSSRTVLVADQANALEIGTTVNSRMEGEGDDKGFLSQTASRPDSTKCRK